jgi:hypothetical protein
MGIIGHQRFFLGLCFFMIHCLLFLSLKSHA